MDQAQDLAVILFIATIVFSAILIEVFRIIGHVLDRMADASLKNLKSSIRAQEKKHAESRNRISKSIEFRKENKE